MSWKPTLTDDKVNITSITSGDVIAYDAGSFSILFLRPFGLKGNRLFIDKEDKIYFPVKDGSPGMILQSIACIVAATNGLSCDVYKETAYEYAYIFK